METKKKVTGIIQIYSRKARDQIFGIGEKYSRAAGLEFLTEDIFSCVDELIKNSVKANYKFLLIFDTITAALKEKHPEKTIDQIREELFEIIKDKEAYDTLAAKTISQEEISDRVRLILNEEGKYLNIRNKTYDEHRDYT